MSCTETKYLYCYTCKRNKYYHPNCTYLQYLSWPYAGNVRAYMCHMSSPTSAMCQKQCTDTLQTVTVDKSQNQYHCHITNIGHAVLIRQHSGCSFVKSWSTSVEKMDRKKMIKITPSTMPYKDTAVQKGQTFIECKCIQATNINRTEFNHGMLYSIAIKDGKDPRYKSIDR